jgi:hypothetical protein
MQVQDVSSVSASACQRETSSSVLAGSAPREPSPDAPLSQWAAFCAHPLVHPHACKLAYQEEWRKSLCDSHPRGAALGAALEAFEHDVHSITQRWPNLSRELNQGLTRRLAEVEKPYACNF